MFKFHVVKFIEYLSKYILKIEKLLKNFIQKDLDYLYVGDSSLLLGFNNLYSKFMIKNGKNNL